tara:strand:+ start:4345 stop:5979 length:1635 start_codon:yes stop_codon:yes gene_type:complete
MEILQLSKYEERSYRETPNREGFVNYGDDNLFPQYLVDLYHSSATHNALVTSIAMMIFGEGFDASDLEGRLAFDQWNLNDELRKACLDFKIQGGFALEVNWSLDRTTIANVSHLPFENVRSGFVNEDEKVESYFYSKDWSDKREEPVELCPFNEKEKLDHPTQIMYVKPFSPGSYYYPKPDYIGSINYIELDKEISIYHINNIQNGMSPSFSIHFKNGIPPQEERNRIRMDIERQLSGAGNAGKFIVTYSDDPERKPDFEPFQLSDADKQYQFLSEEVTGKIMIGHRVTNPMLFGVSVPGKLGGGAELEASEAIFEKNVIRPARKVVEEAVKTLLNAAGLQSRLVPVATELAADFEGPKVEAAEWLIEQGEEMGEDWELIEEVAVDYDLEEKRDALWAFARAIVPEGSRPTAGESEQDTELIKVRYVYAGDPNPQREFCRKMMSARRVYRYEDIIAAGDRAVNRGFGPNGTDTYSIWLYKGGPNCRHFWKRHTYLRKNNKKISVNQAKKVIREAGVGAKRLEENDRRVATRPTDMPNNGYLNPR